MYCFIYQKLSFLFQVVLYSVHFHSTFYCRSSVLSSSCRLRYGALFTVHVCTFCYDENIDSRHTSESEDFQLLATIKLVVWCESWRFALCFSLCLFHGEYLELVLFSAQLKIFKKRQWWSICKLNMTFIDDLKSVLWWWNQIVYLKQFDVCSLGFWKYQICLFSPLSVQPDSRFEMCDIKIHFQLRNTGGGRW